MKHFIAIIILGVMAVGCSSSHKRELGEETAWICTSAENAKKTGFKEIKIPGKKTKLKNNNTCVIVKGDRDPYWDFYIRDYERDQLPKMPELP